MGPRDHRLGAVAAAHLAVGRQGVAVVVEYPGAWQEAGRTVRQGAALPKVRKGQGTICGPASCQWARAAGGRQLPRVPCVGPELGRMPGARPALWASPIHPGSPVPKRLTHGPQVRPGCRAVWGRLAHQLVDRGQLVDTAMYFVHGREDRPVGRRLQVAPAQKVTTRVGKSTGGFFPIRSPPRSAPAAGGWKP